MQQHLAYIVDQQILHINSYPYRLKMYSQNPESCITICIDTSSSMFNSLSVVNEQVMNILSSLAARNDSPKFNLVEFNAHATMWSDKLVQCTPETVSIAEQWLNNLILKEGKNTQEALLTALADPECQAVYLITGNILDHSEEALDKTVRTSGGRSIHCIYITDGIVEEATTEFLEDLAVETSGSFCIITLSKDGRIQKIAPVYHSDPSLVTTLCTFGSTLQPSVNICSPSTSLWPDSVEMFQMYPHLRAILMKSDPPILPSLLMGTWPYHNYPYYWSNYQPGFFKMQEVFREPIDGISLTAGSLLLGRKVIARRVEDGYFYKGTVQSQNLGRSFLMSFGPSKHGKYHQTQYENVFIYDIVDYCDALSHPINTGNRVLAPWEPEGERFAPGIVIEGQEKRQSDSSDNKDLTVTFSNGKTEKVLSDVAVWIPPAMYDRLSLELQMPVSARKILLSTLENYPFENLPGYPKMNYQPNYIDPTVLETNSILSDPFLSWYSPYFQALYGFSPLILKYMAEKKGEKSAPNIKIEDDDSSIIPNTGMTKQELENRVMAQIMEHRCSNRESLDDQSDIKKGSSVSRLLRRRDQQKEYNLNKHVHFESEDGTKNQEMREKYYVDDSNYDDYGNLIKNDSAVNTDSSLLFYSSTGIRHRPTWKKFWHKDPIPPYSSKIDSSGGVKRLAGVKSFRETAFQAPLEGREQRIPPYDVEWISSAFKYVDTFAKHDHSNSVKECLTEAKPAGKEASSQHTGSYTVGSQPVRTMTAEERETVRSANRRRRVLKRESEWQEKLMEEDNVKSLMQDNHRARILNQIERDRQRQMKEYMDIHQTREAKKKINAEFRLRIEVNQNEEAKKEARKISALVKGRERREQIQAQRDKEIQECIDRREQIRKQNNETRTKAQIEQLNEEEIQAAKLSNQYQKAKLHRLHHFQNLEKESQKKKDLRLAVREQNQVLVRSQIFS